jgi:glutathione synthase
VKIAFLVNQPRRLEPDQTTTALLERAATLGHEVWAVGVGALSLAEPGRVRAAGFRVGPGMSVPTALGAIEPLDLEDVDAVLIRTNPNRPAEARRRWAHAFAIELLERLEDRGVAVINRPVGVRRLGGKPGAMLLDPSIRPRTLVTRDRRRFRAFVKREGRVVVKPANGTHGGGVFILEPDDPNLDTAFAQLRGDGMVVCQNWLPDATDGDVRLFLVDGEMFTVDGHVAAVRRRPQQGELRSNVHLGAVPEPVEIDDTLCDIAAKAGPTLMRLGVRIAGLDCIGSNVVEINAFSPGGLGDCARFYGVDFTGPLLERLLAGVQR